MVDFFEVLRTSTCIVHEPSRRSEKPGAAAIGSGGNRRHSGSVGVARDGGEAPPAGDPDARAQVAEEHSETWTAASTANAAMSSSSLSLSSSSRFVFSYRSPMRTMTSSESGSPECELRKLPSRCTAGSVATSKTSCLTESRFRLPTSEDQTTSNC